ncbi:RHS repeat-associated core domain-containing protein [Cohnella ginsengisoli]|uniref:RHS repeat-associated core domain-containing protein n=1 Tax=Cohnella ginsengisoli TaxID=425004 RepID=A0A9X4QQQ0_9BACL|nr:RHS repeat-associated core domain-containing protein [Cohnella ginsengisoli]MDG0795138.1 RHS repeat-associated core domain-containing protein [Cohnella ginsengisoli]
MQQYSALGQFTGFAANDGVAWLTKQHDVGGMLERSVLASGRSVQYGYESFGNKRITAMDDPDLKRAFTYADNTDRVRSLQTQSAGGDALQGIEYTYDGADVLSMNWTGAAEGQFAYTYDSLSRLTNIRSTVTTQVNGVPRSYTLDTPYLWDRDSALIQSGPFSFTRNGPEGRIGVIQDGTLKTDVTYNELGRVQSIRYTVGGREVYRVAYEHDLRGLLTGRTITTPEGTSSEVYEYDADGQLLLMSRNGPGGESFREAYTYDRNKNRLSRETSVDGRVENAYGANDQLRQVGNTAYTFDADGFLLQRGDDRFHYGTMGELLSATVTGVTYSYEYDALGRRTAREGGGGAVKYYYGHPGALQMVTTTIDAQHTATNYYYNDEGLLIGLERGGNRYYVVTDGVGTPQRVLDASGNVVKKLSYDSYGVLLSDSNPDFELLIGFAGGMEDRATGLVRFGARDYDPAAGRWTARDPVLLESGQANLYAYVNNNPVELRDPCGLFCIGFTAYEGVGGGGKVCVTDEGVSACGEIGFGIGGRAGGEPLRGLVL